MLDHNTITLCIGYLSGTLNVSQEAWLQHSISKYRELLSEQKGQSHPPRMSSVDQRVVFYLLPDEFCWLLACDLAEHVTPILLRRIGQDNRPQEIVCTRRQWLLGKVNDEALKKAKEVAQELIGDTARDPCALCVAGSLFNCVSLNRQSSVAAASASEKAVAAAQLFQHYQESTCNEFPWAEENERKWQVDHIQHVLTQAMLYQDLSEFLKAVLQQ